MNPSTTPAASPLRQRMLDDMRLRELDAKTQSSYIRAVRRLAMYLGRSPDTVSPEDLRDFQRGHSSLQEARRVRRLTAWC